MTGFDDQVSSFFPDHLAFSTQSSSEYACVVWGSELSVELARLRSKVGLAMSDAAEITEILREALDTLWATDSMGDVFSGG